jgi:phosphohistidine phosphatase
MKTLIVVRHAEAAPGSVFQKDFDRPLTKEGRAEAARMGNLLREKGCHVDIILASPAARTHETAAIIAEATGCPPEKIKLEKGIYNGPPEDLKDAVSHGEVPEEANTLLLIAHNPGISWFALAAAPELRMNYLPPCGMVGLQLNIRRWKDFSFSGNTLLFFDFPKNT